MTDNYCRTLFRITLAKIAQNTGFTAASTSSMDVLQDLLSKYMHDLCDNLRLTTELCERNEPIVDDVGLVFSQMGVSLREIIDYMNQVAPIPFPHKVSNFPVARPDKLNVPRPDHAELKNRPDYIPPYLPLLHGEEPKKEKETATTPAIESSSGSTTPKIGNRKSFLPQKNEQLRGDEWLNELYDCDALKVGLVKMVEIVDPPPKPKTPPVSVPPPPAPPKLDRAAPSLLLGPQEQIFNAAGVTTAKATKFQSPYGFHHATKTTSKVPKFTTKHEQRISMTSFHPVHQTTAASTAVLPAVEKQHSNNSFSIDECISSVIEQTSGGNGTTSTAHNIPKFKPVPDTTTRESTVMPHLILGTVSAEKSTPAEKLVYATTGIGSVTAPPTFVEKLKVPPAKQSSATKHSPRQLQQFDTAKFLLSDNSATVAAIINAQEIVSAFTEEWTKNAKIAISTASPVVQTTVSEPIATVSDSTESEKAPPVSTKKQMEEKEPSFSTKKRKAESSTFQSPLTAKRLAPPPMPAVDTSTLFKPDVKVVATKKVTAVTSTASVVAVPSSVSPTKTVKKLEKPEKVAEELFSPPQPQSSAISKKSPVTADLRPQTPIISNSAPATSSVSPSATTSTSPSGKPTAATAAAPKKFGALKIKLQLPSTTTTTVAEKRQSPSDKGGGSTAKISGFGKKRQKNKQPQPEKSAKNIDVPPEKSPATKKRKVLVPPAEVAPPPAKISPAIDERVKSITPSPTPSELVDDKSAIKLKIPKLILKLGPKPPSKRENKRHQAESGDFQVSSIKTEPFNEWSNDDEFSRHSNSNPSPRPPSLHSNSHTAASSPPPPTPSPRSLSPSSPITIFIPESETVVLNPPSFEKSVDFSKTSYSSPVESIPLASTSNNTAAMDSSALSIEQKEQEEEEEEEKVWYCPVCQIPYEEGADMIACDKCDNWFHWTCVGLTKAPPDHEQWYCKSCVVVRKPKPPPRKRLKK